MYNRLYKNFAMNNILHEKEIDFKEGYSTEHAVIRLTDQINSSFEKNLLKLGIFIDLAKAFDITHYQLLISKLQNFAVNRSNLRWYENYLNNRKQFPAVNKNITTLTDYYF